MDPYLKLRCLLKEIVELSCHMVSAAKNGQWNVVVELEYQRSPHLLLLENYFNSIDEYVEISNFFRETATFIINSDQEIERLAELHKMNIIQEYNDLDTSRKAVNAYLDNVSL